MKKIWILILTVTITVALTATASNLSAKAEELQAESAGLRTVRTVNENGDICFSVTLPEDLADSFQSAELMTFEQLDNSGAYFPVWRSLTSEPDESRTVTAVYQNKAIYVVDDNTGEVLTDPISYLLTKEDALDVYVFYWDENQITDSDMLTTVYTLGLPKNDSPTLHIEGIFTNDPETDEMSFPVTIDQSFIEHYHYKEAAFYTYDILPVYEGNILAAYTKWNRDSVFMASTIHVPCSWHFEVRDYDNNEAFVTFQIKDKEGKAVCSEMVRVDPDSVKEYDAEENRGNMFHNNLGVNISALYHAENGRVDIPVSFECLSEEVYSIRINNIVLNNQVLLDILSSYSREGEPLLLTIPWERLAGIEEIRTLDFDLELIGTDYGRIGEEHLSFNFPTAVPVAVPDSAPHAVYFKDGDLQWSIRSVVQEGNGQIKVYYDVTNKGKTERKLDLEFALEGYKVYGSSVNIAPGMTTEDVQTMFGQRTDSDDSFQIQTVIREPLIRLGIEELRHIRFFYHDSWVYPYEWHEAVFELSEPVILSPQLPSSTVLDRELANENGMQIVLDTFTEFPGQDYTGNAKKTLSFGLWLFNNTEDSQTFHFWQPYIDDEPAITSVNDYTLFANTCQLVFYRMEAPDDGLTAEKADFTVSVKSGHLLDADITLDLAELRSVENK